MIDWGKWALTFKRIAIAAALAHIAFSLDACAARPRSAPTKSALAIERSIIGHSVENRAIEAISLSGAAHDAALLIIASIHGSEPAGTPLVEWLAIDLCANPERIENLRIMIVPNANPDGLAKRRRHNAHGIDLNRNFPSESFRERRRHGSAPLSEPESRALHDLIVSLKPHAIISIHQPLACIDYDGPAEALALTMSSFSDLPVRKLGALPGSLGSFAGIDLNIPTITLELPGEASSLNADQLWQRYGDMMLAAIAHVADNTGPPPPRNEQPESTSSVADR